MHTRIDETIQRVTERAHVGNCYINRNIVGAVVGVQPFGGEGLSGTGPKAGGPLYLYRLLSQRRDDALLPSLQALDAVHAADFSRRDTLQQAHPALVAWMEAHQPTLAAQCRHLGEISQAGSTRLLIGPTGEQNSYRLLPREHILCLADQDTDLLIQLAATTSIGARALWMESPQNRRLFAVLPDPVSQRITLLADWTQAEVMLDAVLFHGDSDQLRNLAQTLAARHGPLIALKGYARGGRPDSAGAAVNRTCYQRQYRSRGQCHPDDYRLSTRLASVRRLCRLALSFPPPPSALWHLPYALQTLQGVLALLAADMLATPLPGAYQ